MYQNQQKDDDWRAILKNAQQALSEVVQEKKEVPDSKKRKQAVMDNILTSSP